MAKIKATELIGQRFNKLIVQGVKTEKQANGKNRTFLNCLCDCGNTKLIRCDSIKTGNIKSCGSCPSSLLDLIGQKFGRLIIQELDINRNNKAHVICKCDCGTIKSIAAYPVINGITTSCGCYAKEVQSQVTDITEQRFSRLLVQELEVKELTNGKNAIYWKCLCDCGNTTTVRADGLQSGQTTSCGCYAKEQVAKANKARSTHAMYGSTEYNIWRNIKARCTNPNEPTYKYYGGRGIVCCPEWLNSFQTFFADMGNCPKGYSIDRIDNLNGGYNKENCRWATKIEQANNTRSNVFLEFNGKKLTVSQWAREINIPVGALEGRLKKGWDIPRALTTPLRIRKNSNSK